MSSKRELISNLLDKIRSAKSNGRESVDDFKMTLQQAEEFLFEIKSGKFDLILNSENVRLSEFAEWYLFVENKKEISLKDYRMFVFKKQKDYELYFKKLKKNSESSVLEFEKKYEKFLNIIKSGIYDEVLNSKNFWFGIDVEFDKFMEWVLARDEEKNSHNPTLENYSAFASYMKMMNHVKKINESENGCYTTRTYQHQTETTEEELQRLEIFKLEIIKMNYDWREAREVARKLHSLDIYENNRFPHNIYEIISVFIKESKTAFQEFDENNECCHLSDEITKRAKEIADNLTCDTLKNIFLNEHETKVDEYIRKMILSQFDIKLIIKNTYLKISEEELKDILENPNNYSKELIEKIFSSDNFRTLGARVTLYNLAFGTLYSLFGFSRDGKIDIYEDAVKSQKRLDCDKGTVHYNDVNILNLPNGEVIYSTYYEDIKLQYELFQREYEYICDNSKSDLEFIECCTEIMGNVMLSQIFREGNKRTAKCLFNQMLLAKGIVPPIIDFNSNEKEMFIDFACNRKNKYLVAKRKILQDSVKLNEFFKGKYQIQKL